MQQVLHFPMLTESQRKQEEDEKQHIGTGICCYSPLSCQYGTLASHTHLYTFNLSSLNPAQYPHIHPALTPCSHIPSSLPSSNPSPLTPACTPNVSYLAPLIPSNLDICHSPTHPQPPFVTPTHTFKFPTGIGVSPPIPLP